MDNSLYLSQPLSIHLSELRRRLVNYFLFLTIAVAISYNYADSIYSYLTIPLEGSFNAEGRAMIFTSLTEGFFTYLKLALFAGFFISFPALAWNAYFFIAPGLYKKEKKKILPYLLLAPILFLLGALLAYKFVIPAAWNFFVGFENITPSSGMPIILQAKISEYLSLVTSMIIGFGIAFQLPIIMTLLTQLGLVNIAWLKGKRRHAIVLIFIVAAVLTPPDIMSQIMLAIPLLILFEASLFVCTLIMHKKQKVD
jgi:sec-independent protein translocase protein TatC